ncbi:TPA: SIR2 family protein [Enterobacter asburiae]|nr:SIR2 family protein [Enterobacter asburiae]HDR2803443.1 SIR2 family protein [Enterobacter asburiae]HDR2808707.1 SIR2 family protein [Enterobacter asburiae]HDR2814144.1 SIR2 family protein [Enterobacter asburiae]
MRIDEIISEMEGDGPRSYYYFEAFIHHLFKKRCDEQNKEYIVNNDAIGYWDAFAPNGIDDINGNTVIEIKFNLSNVPPKLFLEKTIKYCLNNTQENKIDNILVVSAKPISERWMNRFHEEIKSYPLYQKIKFWGPSNLNKIVNKHQRFVNEISNNLFSLRLKTAILEPLHDWKKERDEIILKLRDLYKKGQFSLFLGAGVSSSAGMANWSTLLNSLFVSYLTKESDNKNEDSLNNVQQLVSRLNEINEPSALMTARYLRKGLTRRNEETQDFISTVTKNLYSLRDKSKDIDSDLIKTITSMCLPKRTGAKIKSVITYNFDDLLERQLSFKAIQHKCIYTDGESYDPDELPVYHVHGFLPENRDSFDGLGKSTLVFSEEGYHKIYSDYYHWSNLVQLNNFRENNCLMIGLSMTDPNLRRLLDISSKSLEQSKHFAFMQRITLESFCFEHSKSEDKKEQVVDDLESAKDFLSKHHVLNEGIMKELGVTIVWFEEYEEIPELLNKVILYEDQSHS